MTFIEPTRRLPFAPPFTYEGRYGAALVAVLLGGYLLLNSNVAQLALGLSGRTGLPIEQTAVFLLHYLFAVGVVLFGLAIAPGASGRRVMAVVVVLIAIVLWTILYAGRITGMAGPLPFASVFIAAPSFIVPLAIGAGWLIVRERPAITYLFLLLSILGGVVPFLLALSGAPSVASQLLLPPVALVLGVGIAWLARAVAAAIGGMHARSALVDQPPAV